MFGVFGHPEAAHLSYYGLHALQHRGQESAGICTSQTGSNFTTIVTWGSSKKYSIARR